MFWRRVTKISFDINMSSQFSCDSEIYSKKKKNIQKNCFYSEATEGLNSYHILCNHFYATIIPRVYPFPIITFFC